MEKFQREGQVKKSFYLLYIAFSSLHELVEEKTKKNKKYKIFKINCDFIDGLYLSSVIGTLAQILRNFHNKQFSRNARTVKQQQVRVSNIQSL